MEKWRQTVPDWYPDLHTKTYFVPPVYFNRTQYEPVNVAGQHAFVVSPQADDNQSERPETIDVGPQTQTAGANYEAQAVGGTLSKQENRRATSKCRKKRAKGKERTVEKQVDASRGPEEFSMWTREQSGEPTVVSKLYPSDLREDFSQQHVLHNIQALSERLGGARFVVSQLSFTDYLNKVDPSDAASIFPRSVNLDPSHRRGDFDVLVIDSERSLLVAEIKSIGLKEKELKKRTQAEADEDFQNRLWKAVGQLDKSETVVKHLISDLAPDLAVRKTLILPYIKTTQLQRVLAADSELGQAFCKCLNAPDEQSAIQLCLCSEHLSPVDTPWDVPQSILNDLVTWWGRLMTCTPDPHMKPATYLDLVARFCGPATSVKIHFGKPLRLEVRTIGQAVSECGDRLCRLHLTRDQVKLLHQAPDTVHLAGPPGTGKSILLVLMGLIWLRKGYDVHVVSSNHASFVMTHLIHHQLTTTQRRDTSPPSSTVGKVHLHDFDFLNSPEDVDKAVETLVKGSDRAQPLCVLMDEVFAADRRMAPQYQRFTQMLRSSVERLCLWAASIRPVNIPTGLQLERLTVPLRSAPLVVREVGKGVEGTRGLVDAYTTSGTASPCDGPSIIRLRHEGRAHTGEWPDGCFKCGQELAEVLRGLHVGVTGQDGQTAPLQYNDVFVLTRSSDLHDEIRDADGRVTSPANGLIIGLRAADIPVLVMDSVVNITDEAKWKKNAIDTALGKCEKVVVADPRALVGLERKIVVYLPGRWRGVDEKRSRDTIETIDRVFQLSRCTAQLIIFDVPDCTGTRTTPDSAGTGSDITKFECETVGGFEQQTTIASGIENMTVSTESQQKEFVSSSSTGDPDPRSAPESTQKSGVKDSDETTYRKQPTETVVCPRTGLWPVLFSTDDLKFT